MSPCLTDCSSILPFYFGGYFYCPAIKTTRVKKDSMEKTQEIGRSEKVFRLIIDENSESIKELLGYILTI